MSATIPAIAPPRKRYSANGLSWPANGAYDPMMVRQESVDGAAGWPGAMAMVRGSQDRPMPQ